MNKILSIIVAFLVGNYILLAGSFNASVSINPNNIPIRINNPKLYFGCFLEFLNDFINGHNGLWAQEIYNRGFDDVGTNSLPAYWLNSNNSVDNVSLVPGGFNENGLFSIIIKSNQSGIATIQQDIYLESSVGSNFYIYLKNNNSQTSEFVIRIKTKNNSQVLYENKIQIQNIDWKKYVLDIPALKLTSNVVLELGLSNAGEIEMDEVSIMPSNNVNGIRKEFFDLFKEWSPGIIRYPGGYFADMDIAHFEYSIGPIDKRRSPMKSWEGHYQRMDFGLNEFVAFCRAVNAEPHLVVNLLNGTPQEAANFVEYCNSPSTTVYGNKRVQDGHWESYRIKYWEIGNEQWNNNDWMLPRYLEYHEQMNAKDSTLHYIIDGDVWQGKPYFKECLEATKTKCNNYGWHYLIYTMPKSSIYDDKERYKIAIGSIDELNYHILDNESWLISDDYYPAVKQSITEQLLNYNISNGWIDTNSMNASLEAGLIESGFLMNFLNSPKTFELYEKTFGLGHIRIGINSDNKRVFYPTVTHNALSFIRNNSGNYSHSLNVLSPRYNTEFLDGMFQLYDIPTLHCSLTSDSISNYLYVLNKDYEKDVNLLLDSTLTEMFNECEVYDLQSNDIRDCNSPDNPQNINFKKNNSSINDIFTIKPHSLRLYKSNRQNNEIIKHSDMVINIDKPRVIINNITNVVRIIVYDLLGNEITNNYLADDTSGSIVIDLSGVNTGIYILKFQLKDQIFIKKLIY